MRAAGALLGLALAACSSGPTGPAPLDTRNESCAHCRMRVSDARFAAQLVAPREEPLFFDDLGCLRDWLRNHPERPRGGVAFAADHRTKEWVRAESATYTEVPGLETPMASHLVAHRDPASRDADPAAAGGRPVSPTALFGPAGPPGGAP